MPTRVIKVTRDGEAAAAEAAARALRQGKLVGFPTETVYGVAALATNGEAMERLRELKSRPQRPFSVHLGRPERIGRYVQDVPEFARRLMNKGWPGPLTLVVPTGGRFADPALGKARLYETLCAKDWIGLRCPAQPVAQAMLEAVDGPVVAPSANRAGAPSPRTAKDVLAWLDGQIDLLLDGGATRYGLDSTIVRCGSDGWTILRSGVYGDRAVRRLLRRRLLFVCTGNTCRSPMAAGLAKRMLADRYGCNVSGLRGVGLEVVSAGVAAGKAGRASPEAVRAARRLGANIARHRSQKLTPDLIETADLILCMTDFHVDIVRRMVPSAADRAFRLDPVGNLPDPIGGGPEVYRSTAERIRNALNLRLEKGIS